MIYSALNAARFYVRHRAWFVLPLFEMRPDGRCACPDPTKYKKHSPGKHPRTWHGVKDASIDSVELRAWWTHSPRANVGIATGLRSGLVVLDIDPRNGGDESLADLERKHGRLPETAKVNTGSGGWHYYFAHPGDRTVGNSAALGGFRGIDLKADGGYVVAPPSNHKSGGAYSWEAALHVTETPLAPCPTVLLELLDARQNAEPESFGSQPWDGTLPPRVARLLVYSDPIRARFKRSKVGLGDTSTSGIDYSLACQLALCGMEGAEIDHAVRASRIRAELGLKHDAYIRHTVEKALGWAREQKLGA